MATLSLAGAPAAIATLVRGERRVAWETGR